MSSFLDKLKTLQGETATAAFARRIGVNQKTLDHLVKGERKPSVEVVVSICSSLGVSSDWLLGLSPAQGNDQADWRARANAAEKKLERVNKALGHALKGFEELQEAVK